MNKPLKQAVRELLRALDQTPFGAAMVYQIDAVKNALEAEEDSPTVSEILSVEYGFKACERGYNLEHTLLTYRKIIKGES